MSQQLIINKKEFIPLKEAAAHVSYSVGYVMRLAREQKIIALQVGRKWYVELASLKNYSTAAELEQTIRKQRLSLDRKQELLLKESVQVVQSKRDDAAARHRSSALVLTSLVIAAGLVSGGAAHLAWQMSSVQTAAVGETRAIPVNDGVTSLPPEEVLVTTTVLTDPSFPHVVSTSPLDGPHEGILLLPSNAVEDLSELFSDAVFTSHATDTTLVVLVTPSGETRSIPFVSIPTSDTSFEASSTGHEIKDAPH